MTKKRNAPCLARPPQNSFLPQRSRTRTRPSAQPCGPCMSCSAQPTRRRPRAPSNARGQTRAVRGARRDAGGTRDAPLLREWWTTWAAWYIPGSSRCQPRRHARRHLRGAPRAGALRPPIWGQLSDVHTGVVDGDVPIDDGDNTAVGAVAVWEERVVHADALEGFYDAERRTGQDGLDGPWRWHVVFGWCSCVGEGGRGCEEGLGLKIADAV